MTAAFNYLHQDCWGTNGAIECCIEKMEAHARTHFGADDDLTTFLRGELDGFFPGMVVFLDATLRDVTSRARFLACLDAAIPQLDREFTPLGRDWIRDELRSFRTRVADDRLAVDEPACMEAALAYARTVLSEPLVDRMRCVVDVTDESIVVMVMHGDREWRRSKFRVSRSDLVVSREGEPEPF